MRSVNFKKTKAATEAAEDGIYDLVTIFSHLINFFTCFSPEEAFDVRAGYTNERYRYPANGNLGENNKYVLARGPLNSDPVCSCPMRRPCPIFATMNCMPKKAFAYEYFKFKITHGPR